MILVNGVELKVTTFPNGEVKIREPYLTDRNVDVVLKWSSDQDILNLFFLKDYLDQGPRNGGLSYLEILYLPYSRMDREIKGDLFTLKTVCKMINSMKWDAVTIHEPHSDVSPALIDRVIVKNTTMDLFNSFEKTVVVDCVFYPDAGAQKRYHTTRYPNLVGNKVRNPQTGRIESFSIAGIENGEYINYISSTERHCDPTVVIMDDLSSYGGTFMYSAKALKRVGAGDIYLIIAHAEKSILKGEIFSSGLFKKVLTTNSILDIKDGIGNNTLQIDELY